jgi:hypothetical protein
VLYGFAETGTRWPSLGSNYNLKSGDMKKKPPVLRLPNPKMVLQPDDRSWHNGGDIEIHLYARSLQKAGKNLIGTLDLEPNLETAWDACPIILLYREAVELHLKFLVGEGSNFLTSPTDPISLYQTHSLRWLAQIVCQIIRKVRWENEFKCEGVAGLADFSALVAELEAMEPVSCAVLSQDRGRSGEVPEALRKANVLTLIPRLDALIGLLEGTADALAATWDLQTGGTAKDSHAGDSRKPTIH